jgi:hypothetical protein
MRSLRRPSYPRSPSLNTVWRFQVAHRPSDNVPCLRLLDQMAGRGMSAAARRR